MNKRAIILAGGVGSRLRPYTVVLPKPLMPIGDYPILEVIIRQLVCHGFDHITMAVNHQAELIKAFFRDGSKWNVRIDYSLEDKPLGTMGPLRLIPDLPENFLMMNGDILTNMNYSGFYEDHVREDVIFTISSHRRAQKIDYGILGTDKDSRLISFTEKPVNHFEVSMGVYMVNRKVLEYIPDNILFGFDQLMLELLRIKKPVRVSPFDGYWLDIGRPDDYMKAIDEFEEVKALFLNE